MITPSPSRSWVTGSISPVRWLGVYSRPSTSPTIPLLTFGRTRDCTSSRKSSPYHRADLKALPEEDAVREAIGKANPAPGLYFTPYCTDMKQMREPAMKEKFEKGPIAMITVSPK